MTVEFPMTDRDDPFKFLVRQHNENLASLRSMRSTLARHAAELTMFLFVDYPITEGARAYWTERDRNEITAIFAHRETGVRGNAGCFDPWDGWWSGDWRSGGDETPQLHIWDRTRAFSDPQTRRIQHIQPVSQRTRTAFRHRHVTQSRLRRAWRRGTVNLAINVWASGEDGITGWVIKKEGREAYVMPHLGYLLNGHTLIWIAQVFRFREDQTSYPMSENETFYMFFEWAGRNRQVYGIHGRTFTLGPVGSCNPSSETGTSSREPSTTGAATSSVGTATAAETATTSETTPTGTQSRPANTRELCPGTITGWSRYVRSPH